MQERKGIITFGGKHMTLLGPNLNVGDKAPSFILQANDLSRKSLATYEGKVLILSVVPSLDTGVCDLQTRRFNNEASSIGSHVRILTISCDLPFAQKRWCGAVGVDNLETLSDHYDLNFGITYGVAIKELRLLTRAVFVIGKDGIIAYKQIVPVVSEEVDFQAALDAAKSAAQ